MPRDIRFEIPDKSPRKIESREYKIFKEEERISSIPRTIYEKACRVSGSLIKVKPDEKSEKKLREAVEFTHLKATPSGISSLTILAAFLVSFPTMILIILNELLSFGPVDLGNGIFIFILSFPFVFYLYTYPTHLKKKYEISVGSEMVTMVMYVAMYMRNSPNLERAVRFASQNLSGPLAYELRKLIWDLEIRKYFTIDQALKVYMKKWEHNREFIESVEILVSSLKQVGNRRLQMLDEAVNVVLDGYREKSRHFNQSLRMPVAIIHALGILLPVMGLVLFPIVAVFLDVKATALFIGYDIILPIILFFVINNVLEKRPVTYSKIDITENPDIPPEGKFRAGDKDIPAWPVGFAVFAVISALGFLMFLSVGQNDVMPAVIMGSGIAFGFAVYYFLLTKRRLKVREKTREIEDEFAEALFQLGNQIRGGTPIELSIEQSMKRIENLKIKELFAKSLSNMKSLGLTFGDSFFDKEYGAIRYYPSKLIKSVMRTVVETTKKGVSVASAAMLSVSKYLKGIHDTQEEVQEQLSEAVNSLKFQVLFLSPFISGVIVTMAIIIIRILQELNVRLGETSGAAAGGIGFLPQFNELNITPFQFIIIVVIYLIESSFILSYFINGIENGDDPIGRRDITAYSLAVGYIVFAISLFITLMIFEPLIISAVS